MSWEDLRERSHYILCAAVILVIGSSIWRRGRRPTSDELKALAKGAVGVPSSIFVIGWLLMKKNSEVGGLALVLTAGMLVYGWDSLCAGYDALKALWTKEVPATPPKEAKKKKKKVNKPDTSPSDGT